MVVSMVSGTADRVDRRSRPAVLLAERPEDLLDVQRDAVGPVVDGADHVLRGGQARASRSVVIIPVSDDESRPSRASSASRWVSSLERHSRIGIRG